MNYTAKPTQNPKANKKAKLDGLAKRLKAKLKRNKEALKVAKAALHHCDIRHKLCCCSREAIAEIDAAVNRNKKP